jgi:branched-subunit amino acid transport protein
LAVFALLLAVRWIDAQPYSGDEPHYLLVTSSLILDGDADVKNNYAAGDTLRYFPFPIDAHINPAIFDTRSRHWYPAHGVGLSALLVPAVIAGDKTGSKVMMVLVALAVVVLTFVWTRRFTGTVTAAIGTAVLLTSPFFFGLDGRVFPDLPTAALLLAGLLLLEARQTRKRGWALLGMLVAASPWLHFKNALPFGMLAALALVRIVRETERADRLQSAAALLIPVVAGAVLYELTIRRWYGSWLPTRIYSGANKAFAINDARGMAAASFDVARGLFANNPALLLILPGLPLWLGRYRKTFIRLTLVLLPAILVEATFNDWSGGYSPPGRYVLQFTPALLPAIALLLREVAGWQRAIAGLLVVLNFILGGLFVWLRPAWGNAGEPSPFFSQIHRHVGPSLNRLLPMFDARGTLVSGGLQLGLWTTLAVALGVFGIVLARRRHGSEAPPGRPGVVEPTA